MSANTISFIILVWNSEKYLSRCFDSIVNKCDSNAIGYEIIVIDNGSSDDSDNVIKSYLRKYPDIFRLISLKSNCGTTYSRNLGIKQAQGKFLCILDSDTELGSGDLSGILNRISSDVSIGIIAPRLILPDGSVQNSVKRFPTMLNKVRKIPQIVFGMQTKNADFYDDFPFCQERTVDTAISACWFFRKEILSRVGMLDENIFYSPEDLDFCLRVWTTGLSILYYPYFTVLHHTQQISHKKPLSKTSLSHFWGLVYYYKKHGGWFTRPRLKRSS